MMLCPASSPSNRARDAGSLSAHESMSVAVARALAAHYEVPHDELEPLYEHINPEALNTLFAQTSSGGSRTAGTVSFGYRDV